MIIGKITDKINRQMPKPKILLIDDEKNVAQMLKFRLELSWGYQVTVVNSGKEGMEKARTVDFDLVITDYMMPNMNGEEVLDALKKSKPNLPVFMFSVFYDDDSTITDRIRAKADAIISKPVDFDELHKSITRVLAV